MTYELEPENSDDRHIIEIMKGKSTVTMRQSNKGGIIFQLERPAIELLNPEDSDPYESIPAKGRKE